MKHRFPASVLMAAVAFLLLMVMTGCRAEETAEPVALLHYFTGSLSGGIDALAAELGDADGSVELVPIPLEHEAFKVAVRFQLEGPNPPDLFSYWAGSRTRNLVSRGRVAPLTDLVGRGINPDDFAPGVLDAMSYDGELYMIPITRHFVGFFYNTGVFASLGLSEPKNWEDFLGVVEDLSEADMIPVALGALHRWPAQFWFDYLLLRTAGPEYRSRLMDGRASYGDTETLEALSLFANLAADGVFNADAADIDWDEAVRLVSEGEAGLTLMGTWAIGYYDQIGANQEEIGFFPFPVLDAEVPDIALGPIDGIMLTRLARHPEAAKEILVQMSGPGPQATFAELSGGIAPHRDVSMDTYGPLQREVAETIASSEGWAFNFDLATPPDSAEIGLDALMSILSDPSSWHEITADWVTAVRDKIPMP